MLRLVHPIPKSKNVTYSKGKRNPALTPTPEEQKRIKAALDRVRIMFGGYEALSAVMGLPVNVLQMAKCRGISFALAVLIARAAKIPVETILSGKPYEVGSCPACGRKD